MPLTLHQSWETFDVRKLEEIHFDEHAWDHLVLNKATKVEETLTIELEGSASDSLLGSCQRARQCHKDDQFNWEGVLRCHYWERWRNGEDSFLRVGDPGVINKISDCAPTRSAWDRQNSDCRGCS
jgi:hypothetical protein